MTRGDWFAVILYAGAAVSTGFVDVRVRSYPEHAYKVYMPAVIDRTSGAPALYRVLVPYAFDWLARVTGISRAGLWHASRLLLIAAAYGAFHWYLRTWFPPVGALSGTLLVAALLPLTFTNSWAHPDHFAELFLFTLGCAAIARGHEWLFAAVLVAATLNRETAAFLVALYAAAGDWSRRHLSRTAGFAAVFATVYVGLRVWRGFEGYDYWQLWRNVEFLKLLPPPRDPYYRAYAWFCVVAFAPLLWVALRARTEAPLFIRRALWVVPAFGAVAFTLSSIIETRIFTPLFPLIVPAVVWSVLETSHASVPTATGNLT